MSHISPDDLLSLFADTADAVAGALNDLDDWGLAGTRLGQHHSDLAADRVATNALLDAGLGVCSEESGLQAPDRSIIVVLDPLDGSTNAAQGIPWYATSLCAVDDHGALAALVVNLASGERYAATRGGGAHRDGEPIRPSAVTELSEAILGLSGWWPRAPRWRQYRALGAAALDLCAVADGRLDGFADCHSLGPWDYLGAMLVCREAGAAVVDAAGRDLTTTDPLQRRTLLAAAGERLLADLRAAWAG
ncbi:MAG: inositol monophosphatase [Acidimicrobiia bacterium]|nr:inositol monophosphatase [Acidimicrobiia bacterium]